MPTSHINRRTLLRMAPLSALGLSGLRTLPAAERGTNEGRGKACILLYMTGGPAQQETFDPKPDGPQETRGEFKPTATSVPGVQICEHLPMMAKLAHQYAIIRSTWHGSDTHGVGVHYNLTGLKHAPRSAGEPQIDRRDPPCIGSVIRQLRGDRNGLPGAVQLPRQVGDQNNAYWGGQHAGFLGPRYDPLFLHDETWIPGNPLPGLAPAADVGVDRQATRADLLDSLQTARPATGSADLDFGRFQGQALDMLRSSAAWKAFKLDEEKPGTIERYGDNRFGRSCLVARRLVEAGVGCVTVPWTFKQSEQNFDTHSKHFPKMKDKLLPVVDRAFSALLEDLTGRGMLDSTLVGWTGEFGRSPKINGGGGRDHWGRVYSTVLAGAGIRGGQVIGRSDKNGGLPADDPVHVSDFFATMYQALGYTSASAVHDTSGRPHHFMQGRPLAKLVG
ncbi:MAG: DUF1501 domain-containing protein [Planctomycetaceae bacterium]|nr:DUF1501 domain-containing protein [Planctomycetaceae bacterium]